MKKTVCFLLCMVVFFACLTVSTAESIDLSSLSYEQLETLQKSLSEEMKSRPEWKGVKVPAGTWTVGIDIPEGEYSVVMVDDTQKGKFSVWGKAVDDFVSNGGCVNPLVFGYEYTVYGKIFLKEGYVISSTLDVYLAPPVTLGF